LAQAPLQHFESFDLTLPVPIIGVSNQASPNGILANIIPFLSVALAVADQMIEKSFLPMWARCEIAIDKVLFKTRTHCTSEKSIAPQTKK
jgi:hypothetical protein